MNAGRAVAFATVALACARPLAAADCARECDDVTKWWAYEDLDLTMTSPGQAGVSKWHAVFDRAHGDVRVDMEEVEGGKAAGHAAVGLVGGRILITRGMELARGQEIDALDGPVLTVKLLYAVLARAFPDGPQSIPASKQVDLHESEVGIRFSTASASGHILPPWQARGTVKKPDDSRLEVDLRLAGSSADPNVRAGDKVDMRFQGTLRKRSSSVYDEAMPLADWKVYGAGEAKAATIGTARTAIKPAPRS